MKPITQYIKESNEKQSVSKNIKRSDIKFTIWKSPDEQVKWIESQEKYQKIEYKLEDKDDHISIDFLLGFDKDTWKLWVGKVGSCSYDDDPYKDLKTRKFTYAILTACDEIKKFVKKVKDDPENYVQFYTNM